MNSVSLRRSVTAPLLALLLPLAACGGGQKPQGPVDGAAAHAHLTKIVGFGPRPFGSDALAKTADYVCEELKKLGLEPKRQELMHETEKKLIRNLYVQIDGEDPAKGPILMIGAHYDTKLASGHDDAAHNFAFVGAIDGGGAPATLLELARVLKAQPKHKVNIWLYWIDAEESIDWNWNDDRALLGSKAFCKMLSAEKVLPRVKAFVLLDLIGDQNYKIDRDGNSDQRLQEIFKAAGTTVGMADRMYRFPTEVEILQIKQEYARRGMQPKWGVTDDHNVFTNFGVPSVLLIDFERRVPGGQEDPAYTRWWHTPADDLSQTSAESLAFAGDLVVAALPDLEAFCLGKK